MRRQNPTILKWLADRGIDIPVRQEEVFTREQEKPRSLEADTVHSKKYSDIRDAYSWIEDGKFYLLDIVRPMTKEADDLWGNDGVRNINGQMRIVSTLKLWVNQAMRGNDKIKLICSGKDRQGRNANGTYTFYLTPDPWGDRDTYVLAIREV